jgi:DNA anti-recombination protein RmuC
MSNDHDSEVTVEIDAVSEVMSEAPQGDAPQPVGADSLGQVREILLGPVSRDLQRRLDIVEKRLDLIVRDVEQRTESRIEETERKLREELSDITSKLGQQDARQCEQWDQANEKIEAAAKELREKTGTFTDEISAVKEEVLSKLSRDIDGFKEEVRRETRKRSDGLVDRATLSSLFSELALRLNGEMKKALDFDESEIDLDRLIESRTSGET